MNEYVKHSKYGPGGPSCVCCGPSPKQRKAFERGVKRKVRQKVRKEILELVKEIYSTQKEGDGL